MAKGTHNRFGKSYHQYSDGYSDDYPDMFSKGKGGFSYHKSEAGTPWADAYDDDDEGDDGKGRHTSWRDSRRGKGPNDDWSQSQTWRGNDDDWYYESERSRQGWQDNSWRDSRPGKGFQQQADGYGKGDSNDDFRKGGPSKGQKGDEYDRFSKGDFSTSSKGKKGKDYDVAMQDGFLASSKGKKGNKYEEFSKGDFPMSSRGNKGNEYGDFNKGDSSRSSKGKKGSEYDDFGKGDFSTSSRGGKGNDSTMHGTATRINSSRDIPVGHRSEQRPDNRGQDPHNLSAKGINLGRSGNPGPPGNSYSSDGDPNQLSKGNHIMNMLNMPPGSAPSTSTPGSFNDWSLQGKGKGNEDHRTNLPSRFENAGQNNMGKGTHNGDSSMLGKGQEQAKPVFSTTPQVSMSRGMQQVPPRGNCQPSGPGSLDTRPPIPAPPPPPPANFSQNSSMLHPRSSGNAPEGRHLQSPSPGGWMSAGAPGNANAERSQNSSLGGPSGSPTWPGIFSNASPSGNAAAERLQNASLWAPGSASSNAAAGAPQNCPTWANSSSSNHTSQGPTQVAAGLWNTGGNSGAAGEQQPQNSYLWGPAGSSRDGAQGSFASQQGSMSGYGPPGGNPAIAGKGFSGSAPPAEIVSLWGNGSPQQNFTFPPSPGPGSGIRTPSEDGFAFALDEIHHAAAGAFSAEASLVMETSQMLGQSSSAADDIHRAQGDAASRRAADEIQRAQDEASSMWRWEYDAQPHEASHLQAIDFMGAWVDSKGNSVSVCSEDAWQLKLLATLSRPPRPDVHLTIEQAADGGWFCGNSALDYSVSTSAKLHWVRSDGMLSVWMRGRS